MKDADVQKEELLSMLSEIYDQLEELDSVLHTSISEYKRDYQAEHVKRLAVCEEKLSALETEMETIDGHKREASRTLGVILELGYKY